ncbi:MAG TPA: glycosyltransferase [Aeromicrobium sp.]|nr:glycosyltransferase [Aeromicrobium sp.]HKY56791.1 glycosyltransferase [Aeromicrobium sp.]
MRLCFLLAKDPTCDQVGDTAMMTRLLELARADHEVSIICWSTQPELGDRDGVVRLPKPPVSPVRVAGRALRRRRSLLHARYDDLALRAAVEASDADAFVAVHHYLAEAFLHSTRSTAPLHVVNVVPEGPVWRATRGWLGRLQARAIERDETRVIRHAVSVGSYDKADAAEAAAAGARRSVWLELTLRSRPAMDVRSTPPRIAVLGDRTWAPNERAWRRMLDLWPEISSGVTGAELVAIGRPSGSPTTRAAELPSGVTDLGFVDDLPAALARCRALAAPIDVGGGVRVKLLEAASIGLPVVATSAASGSLAELLGIEPIDDDVRFVAACRRLLTTPEDAAVQGARLHAANEAHAESGRAEASVHAWLA